MIRWLLATALFLSAAAVGSAQDLLSEVPSTPEQDSLIAIGIRWHDRKDFDQAIEFYQKALQKNPANTRALYELAFSHYAQGELEEALQTAMEGARYNSAILPELYMIIASVYDDQEASEQAIETYHKAIAISPKFFLLHFNLALALTRAEQGREAEASLQEALRLNPFHPSSHLLLAQHWVARNLRVPALMAYTHFLILEGGTQRAQDAAAVVVEILEGGTDKQSSKEKNVINLSSSSDTSEGNFTMQETTLSLFAATNRIVESALVDSLGVYRTNLDQYIQQLRSAVRLITDATQKNTPAVSFTQQFYLPWYSEIVRLNHLDVFCHLVAANCMIPGAESWLTEHQEEKKAFTSWIKEYRTPK